MSRSDRLLSAEALLMELDVLVVGAGPVGLMAAGELASRGVAVRIIDVLPERSRFVKALGVTPRTLEIFDHIGVLGSALDRGLVSSVMNTVVNGELVSSGETSGDQWPYDFLYLAQPETESILERRLNQFGVSIERECRLVELVDHGDEVEAIVERSGGDTQHLRPRWLVGCDGAHSTVRKQLGLSFDGGKYEITFLVADVELDWDRPHDEAWKIVQLENGELQNMLAIIPIPGNERRFRVSTAIGVGGPDEPLAFPEHPELDFVQEAVAPMLPGTGISELRWSSTYGISHRLVPTYRTGRVLLAGDAAHIHPPIGGLGMNTGLQDAFNLGWKLSMVTRGLAGERLISSYDQERHAVGERVVRETARRMENAMEQKEEDEQAEIDAGTQLDVTYRGGSIVADVAGDAAVQPGDRLPWCDGLVRNGVRRGWTLVDVLRGGDFHVLAWSGRDPGAVADLQHIMETVRGRLGDRVGLTVINPVDDVADQDESVPVMIDACGTVAEALGDDAVVLLVRPDGHVSWMGPWTGATSVAAHVDELLA
ncbi:MAG: FAD-dependent monooxygenase [Phycisphaerales bacterium]|nr:FAD-dependent monooxygenase [Phycisphaerales bacterium]